MIEQRCEITELITSHCACHRHRGDTGAVASDVSLAYRFTAKYPGRCTACGEDYAEGDRIGRTTEDDYVCSGCCGQLAGAA